MKHDVNISKLISYWLRHKPSEAGLEVNEFGWVNIDALLVALDRKGFNLQVNDLNGLNQSFDKVRWEIDQSENRIRATHGHSIPIVLSDNPSEPPSGLFHGTSLSKALSILDKGILPMNRLFVHLSANVNAAMEVGRRHGIPIVIELDTEGLLEKGQNFYQTNDNVWLTTSIDKSHVNFAPWHRVSTEEKNVLLEELKREVSKGHQVFNEIADLELIMRRYDRDNALFLNLKSGKVFDIHLTFKGSKEWDTHYPFTRGFSDLEEWIKNSLLVDQSEWYGI